MNQRIFDYWLHNAESKSQSEAIIHWQTGDSPIRFTYGELLSMAAEFAYVLKLNNVKQGDVCATIIRHNPLFYSLYLGICLAGGIPAVLAYPNDRLHPEKFRQGLLGMARQFGLDWILTEEDLASPIQEIIQAAKGSIKGLLFPLTLTNNEKPKESIQKLKSSLINILPTAPALLQHSSGTTGLQKAVQLSHNAIINHINN